MKKKWIILFFFPLVVELFCCSLPVWATKTQDLKPHKDIVTKTVKDYTSQKVQNQGIQDIYNLLFKEQKENDKINDTVLKGFWETLKKDEGGDKSENDMNKLLFCKAETLFLMDQTYQALVAFYRLKMRLNTEKNHGLFQKVEKRIAEIEQEIKADPTKLDPEQIKLDVFNLLFKTREEDIKFDENELRAFLEALKILEKNNNFQDDKNAILYLRGESLFRMNEYKDAYVAFYRLKMRLNNKNHPLFTVANKRLKTIKRQIQLVKKEPVLRSGLQDFLWPGVLLSFILFLLLIRDAVRNTGTVFGPEIVEAGKLIELEEMREQDGRCSDKTMHEYQDLKKKGLPWHSLGKDKQEKYKFARLLYKGHGMIRTVNNKAPYAITLVSSIYGLNRLSPYWQYSIVGFGFALVWGVAGEQFGLCASRIFPIYALLGAFVLACLSSIKIMSQKTIDALDEMVSMLEPRHTRESIKNLEK